MQIITSSTRECRAPFSIRYTLYVDHTLFPCRILSTAFYQCFPLQIVTVDSSPIVAAVAGGNRTVVRGTEVVLDLGVSLDPDEVRCCVSS